jgi:hypothetical protein
MNCATGEPLYFKSILRAILLYIKNADKENQAQSELNIRANNYYEQNRDANQKNLMKPLF